MDFSQFSIATDNLVIRAFSARDSKEMYCIKTEEGFSKYLFDEPWKCEQDAKEFINFAQWLYTDDIKRGWFRLFFAVCNKIDNKLVGYCGFGNTEFMPDSVEVFYGISIKNQNRGYGYESCLRAPLKTTQKCDKISS